MVPRPPDTAFDIILGEKKGGFSGSTNGAPPGPWKQRHMLLRQAAGGGRSGGRGEAPLCPQPTASRGAYLLPCRKGHF